MAHHHDIEKFRKGRPRRPSPPERKLKTPQYDEMMRRRYGRGRKNVRVWQNGKRLKDIRRRIEFHQSAKFHDFIKDRGKYLIAAACHYPESEELEVWLPRWFADHLQMPGFPDLDVKMQVLIDHKHKLKRLSPEAIAELLPTTFDDRQAMELWTFGAIDMSPRQRRNASKKERRRKERERVAKKRQAAGAKPRAESISRTKPWEAEGISRATWHRRRKARLL
jgi:hypothetical protein